MWMWTTSTDTQLPVAVLAAHMAATELPHRAGDAEVQPAGLVPARRRVPKVRVLHAAQLTAETSARCAPYSVCDARAGSHSRRRKASRRTSSASMTLRSSGRRGCSCAPRQTCGWWRSCFTPLQQSNAHSERCLGATAADTNSRVGVMLGVCARPTRQRSLSDCTPARSVRVLCHAD